MANVTRAPAARKGFVSSMKAPAFLIATTKTADPTDAGIFVALVRAKQLARRPGNAMGPVYRNVEMLSAGMMVVEDRVEAALLASPVWMGSALPNVNQIVEMPNVAMMGAGVPAAHVKRDRTARKAHAWTSAPRIARDCLAEMMDAVAAAVHVKKERAALKDNV